MRFINSLFIKLSKIIYYSINYFNYKYIHPNSRILFSVRVNGKKYIKIQNGCVVQRQGWLLALKIDNVDPNLTIGEGTAIGDFCHITAVNEVVLENNVLIANKVYISDNVHSYDDVQIPIISQKVKFLNKVLIKEGAWIGENVCIIGASVGKNSIVGANSLVLNDIPDYSVAVGTPAKVIKKFSFDTNKWERV